MHCRDFGVADLPVRIERHHLVRVLAIRRRHHQQLRHRHREPPARHSREQLRAGISHRSVNEVASFSPTDRTPNADIPPGYPVAAERRHQSYPVATPQIYEAKDFPNATSAIFEKMLKNFSA